MPLPARLGSSTRGMARAHAENRGGLLVPPFIDNLDCVRRGAVRHNASWTPHISLDTLLRRFLKLWGPLNRVSPLYPDPFTLYHSV